MTKPDVQFLTADKSELDGFFQMMFIETDDYLDRSLEIMNVTKDDFKVMFETIGEIVTISINSKKCGFYWLEDRGKTRHIHALIIFPEYRRQGIGKKVMKHIEKSSGSQIIKLEVGVHQSNEKTIALVKKLNFTKTYEHTDLNFLIFNKELE